MPHILSLRSYWTPARTWVGAHKIWSCIIALVIIGGGWYAYAKATSTTGETRYTLGTVSSSTIIASISGSGQVSPSNQVEIKPKASGEITSILVQDGAHVVAGQTLAYIDATDAQKSVRDAEANLQSAQISLEKLKKPPTQLTMLQAQNAVTNAEDALATKYKDSAVHVSDAFLDFPELMEGIKDIEIGTDTNTSSQWNIDYYLNATERYELKVRTYRDEAYSSYQKAKTSYDKAFTDYKSVGVSPDNDTTEKLLVSTYQTSVDILDAVKKANTLVQFYKDTMDARDQNISSAATEALTNLNTYLGTVNDHLETLLNDTNTLKSDKQAIAEKRASLADTQAGTDALDIKSAELNVTKAQNSLTDARNTLADYAVRAPFAGTMAEVAQKKGEQASSGTTFGTIITSDQIADLSVNEVDAAKILVGQKATLTFDAIEGLSIAGTVASVNTLGTVEQGVVSYAVKIQFSTQDTRVKPGMTVNASIITDTALDTLSVPSSAVKTTNGESYVQVFQPPLSETSTTGGGVVTKQTPVNIPVETGISDDTSIQILSGLTLGEQIVVRTTTGTITTTSTNSGTRAGATGATRAGGGPVFFGR